jgi:hypothetical protein
MGVGHVHGGGFVPHVNEVDAGIQRGVEDRHDVVAGQREDASAADTAKGTSDDVGAAQGVAHRLRWTLNLELVLMSLRKTRRHKTRRRISSMTMLLSCSLSPWRTQACSTSA